MTEAEMQEVASRLYRIKELKERLGKQTDELKYANAHLKAGKSYQVNVTLKPRANDYNSRAVEVHIEIDAGVVQQALLNKVNELRRAIISSGGAP